MSSERDGGLGLETVEAVRRKKDIQQPLPSPSRAAPVQRLVTETTAKP